MAVCVYVCVCFSIHLSVCVSTRDGTFAMLCFNYTVGFPSSNVAQNVEKLSETTTKIANEKNSRK